MKTLSNLAFSLVIAIAANFEALYEQYQKNANSVDYYQISVSFSDKTFYHERFRELKNKLMSNYNLPAEKAENFSFWIINSTHNSPISEKTMTALIQTESSFRYQARSIAGAVGPAQVIPFFWEKECYGDIKNDPQMNIMCGAMILENYYENCNHNLKCALQTYNVGPTNMLDASYKGARNRYTKKIERYKEQFANNQ